MLRAIFVGAIVLLGIRYSFKGPFYILLFYLWLAYFRPDTWLHWDWITPIWLSFTVGFTLVVTTLLSGQRLRFGLGPLLLLAYLLVAIVSSFMSPAPAISWRECWEMARIITVCFMIVTLVNTEARMRMTMLAIGLSLSFEGAKQGWGNLILHPGAVNANPFEFLGDNNGVAVGMLMLVPILATLARTATWRWERRWERFLTVGVIYRALSTYSRGGFLAAIALGFHYLIRSKVRPSAIIGMALVIALILPAMPDAFWERMQTINTAAETGTDPTKRPESAEDFSTQGRLHFWRVAHQIALDRPFTGVGMHVFNAVYDQYDFSRGAYGRHRSVHSSWFGVMAELGFIGFGLFILLFIRAFLIAARARRVARRYPEHAWLGLFGTAIEGSLVVFVVGGTFITFQYNEFVWHFFAMSMALQGLVDAAVERAEAPAVVPVEGAPSVALPSSPSTRVSPLWQARRAAALPPADSKRSTTP
jgi:probable O-glycosylation ligase (exosortase A-associated)